VLHFHDKIKNRTAAAMSKTVKEISFEVDMKGIWIIAVMNGATSAKTIFANIPQLDGIRDIVMTKDMLHGDFSFYSLNIQVHVISSFSLMDFPFFTFS
jgi:hypothetical protein